jgi:hypothetical protein
MASCAPKSLSSASSVDIGARKTLPEDPGRTRPELRVSRPQLKREWSLWPEFGWIPGNLCDLSNGYFATTFLSSSPSLSGRVGVKRFQTTPSIWRGMSTRRVLASLRDRHLGPPMMGSGGCGGPIYRDVLAVRLTAGIRTRNGLASSIVPAGTSLHRSAEFAFSPVVFLLCTTRCEIHERHKCALTARALLFARSR